MCLAVGSRPGGWGGGGESQTLPAVTCSQLLFAWCQLDSARLGLTLILCTCPSNMIVIMGVGARLGCGGAACAACAAAVVVLPPLLLLLLLLLSESSAADAKLVRQSS